MTGATDQNGSFYPAGSVMGLIGSVLMTPVTSAVLQRRIEPVAGTSAPVLGREQLAVSAAVAARLIPQPDRTSPLDLAGALHVRLSDGVGDGWRYADLPPDAETVATGLATLDGFALAESGQPFTMLEGFKQDDLLREVQLGRAAGPGWAGVSPERWFVDDPSASDSDAEGRAHGVPNLTICDNSVFPSALAANPALTIMALSLRTADRFLPRVRRGEN